MASKMTIGKKISLGFALVLIALSGLALWSVMGVSGIVKDASEVIEGNKLRAEMTQREVDHLNWASKVNELFTDEQVTQLNVQTDPHKCGFGKWYYSDARKQGEHLVPELARPLADIEKWHNQLHASAREIGDCFRQADPMLSSYLERCKADHLAWLGHVRQAMLDRDATEATSSVDPHKCRLGKWYFSDQARQLCKDWPELGRILAKSEGPHRKLHESAKQLNDLLENDRRVEAIQVMNDQSIAHADDVCAVLEEAIVWNNKQLAGMAQAHQIAAGKTKPALNHVQECLDEARQAVVANVMTDEQMLSAADTTRAGVMIVSVLGMAVGIVFAVVIVCSTRKVLTGIAADLSQGADQVSVAAEQVSGASQSLASGTTQQAASIEETTASVEEMTSQIRQTSDNARQANELSSTARTHAEKGSQDMERMSTAIDEIKASSDETAKIVKTIDEIAFQTNLLALNAAVEAARAGEAGKGFAVVAEEVRNLAQRSAEAAKNTADLIESSVVRADNGVKISGEVAESLAGINQAATQVNSLIEEIAGACDEQSQGIEQISGAVTEMDGVTQSNAANAEETASAAEELSSQAEQLNFNVQQLQQLVYGSGQRQGQTFVPDRAGASSGPDGDRKSPSGQGQMSHPAQPVTQQDKQERIAEF